VSTRFWPAGEAAQVEYECLRAAALGGEHAATLAAGRFARRGLAGLIAGSWPDADFLGFVIGAARPPWCGAGDPREDALADAYGLLLARECGARRDEAVGR
jgi:hypothetical protein